MKNREDSFTLVSRHGRRLLIAGAIINIVSLAALFGGIYLLLDAVGLVK